MRAKIHSMGAKINCYTPNGGNPALIISTQCHNRLTKLRRPLNGTAVQVAMQKPSVPDKLPAHGFIGD